MKRFFSLTTFLLLMSFLLYQSASFTTVEIKNEATLSIVPEENALIAINYEEGSMFAVTNNTEKAIEIESIGLMSNPANDISNAEENDSAIIGPGESSAFTINGDPTHLLGDSIQIIARWDSGSAEIQSMVPEFYIAQLVREFEEEEMRLELVKEQVTPEICKEKTATEIKEEKSEPEIDEEKATPEICEEKVDPETNVEKTIHELDDEKKVPETNEEQLIPELIKEQPIPEINDEQ